MNNLKIARELVTMARELVADRSLKELLEMVSDNAFDLYNRHEAEELIEIVEDSRSARDAVKGMKSWGVKKDEFMGIVSGNSTLERIWR